MKSWLSGGMLAATIALPALSGAAWADDFTCSNATLQGEYAFGVNIVSQHSVGLGWKYFDGNGNFVQHDYRGNTSPIAFSGEEVGRYQVSSDCTGSLTTQVGGGGSVQALFVISDGGRHIHEVVGALTAGGVNVPVQTSADDWKVAPEQNQQQ
jgi:hypothetical protein